MVLFLQTSGNVIKRHDPVVGELLKRGKTNTREAAGSEVAVPVQATVLHPLAVR